MVFLSEITLAMRHEVPFSLQFPFGGSVTVFWLSPSFGYPRTQNSSVLDIPFGKTQNAKKSELNGRMRQVTWPLSIICREQKIIACRRQKIVIQS